MTSQANPAKPVKHMLLKVCIGGLGGGLVLFAAYIWLAFQYSYSDGERAGFMQNFLHKGLPGNCFGDTEYFVHESRTVAGP